MISVIISTHPGRDERCLKAIQSVIDQTFTDWELVIVHDGKNSTLDISWYKSQDKNPITLYEIDKWGNDTKPKNYGILQSRGELIAFLDSDNEYRPDHLQALYNAIKDEPKIDVVYGDRWIVDENKNIEDQIGVYYDYNPSLLLERNYIDTSDALIRREALFKVGGWDERYKKYVDWNLWLRMSKAGMVFKRVPLVLTDYHLHDDMKSVKVKTKGDSNNSFVPEWDAYEVEIELPYLGEIPEPTVAIYTLTYNRLAYTKKSFDSLWEKADYPFEHFIFDQGSTDGTVEYLKEYEESHKGKVHIIYSEDNKGISIASNRLIDEIVKDNKFRIIMKSDNDAQYTSKGFLKKMVEIWKSNHLIALSCYINGLKDNPGGAQRIGYGKLKGQLLGMTKHLGGICHFVDAKGYKYFRWDTEDFLHGFQDVEFSRYLLMNSWQMGYLENFYCDHINGTVGQHQDFPDYFEKRKTEKTITYVA